jgi:predicted dienelactone hydrolase
LRRFELFLVFGELFAISWPAVFGVRPKRGIASGVLVTLWVAHWQIEGLRWQMLPLYLVAIGLTIGDLIIVERALNWTRRVARGVFGVIGVGLAALLALIFPIPELPVPSGPETIGTITVEIVDTEREETYGPNPAGPRRLMVQVWYPAQSVEGVEPTLWNEDWAVIMPEMATSLGLPSWFFNHTRYTDSHGSESLKVAEGTFPIIVYSHGWTGFRTIALNQIETLVSNGYMVIAADHTYGAVATRFTDGEIVTFDPAALPDEEVVGEEAYLAAGSDLIEVFAGDITAVIDALEAGADGPFGPVAEAADLTRVGLYGHSTGGGAAVRVCLQDERCDAVLGLDAWVEPIPDRIISESAVRPAMYMRSDEWRGTDNDAELRGIAERSEEITYWLGIEGADHNDFVATPLFSPVADNLGLKGPIPAGRVIPIIDRYLLGFFDVFLLGTGSASIETASFEEVSLEVIRPD